MKALILAAGNGKRLNTVTKGHNKCMVRISGKPLVQFNLENAVKAGATEIVIVVGYQSEEIMQFIGPRFQNVPVRYVVQPSPRGLVDAMECAQAEVGQSDFLLFLGDEVLQNPRHPAMIELFYGEKLFGVCGVVHDADVHEVRKTYAVLQDDEGRIQQLIEKPQNPPNRMRGTGNCIFRADLFQFLDATPVNPIRGEKELPDLIQCAINHGSPVKSFAIGDGYFNINSPDDLAKAETSYYNTRLSPLAAD